MIERHNHTRTVSLFDMLDGDHDCINSCSPRYNVIRFVFSAYIVATILPIVYDEKLKMWWMWGVYTLCVFVFSSVISITNQVYEFKHYVASVFSMFFMTSLGVMVYLLVGSLVPAYIDNKNKFPSSRIPSLLNQTEQWCYTSCPESNNMTQSCKDFNNFMYSVDNVLQFCYSRVTQVCPSSEINRVTNECRDKWSTALFAINNSDENTEREWRNNVNLVYGICLGNATTLGVVLICFLIDTCLIKLYGALWYNGYPTFEFQKQQTPPQTPPQTSKQQTPQQPPTTSLDQIKLPNIPEEHSVHEIEMDTRIS